MDPFSAFFLAVWFAYILVLDKVDPKGADRRHAERMQREQHRHEKWLERRRDRRSQRENPSRFRRAMDDRLADWLANAGRRQEKVRERIRFEDEESARTGRPVSAWRMALRNWREAWTARNRYMAERAERRFSTRPDFVVDAEEPAVEEEPGTQYWSGQRLDVDPKELAPASDVEDAEYEDVVHDTPPQPVDTDLVSAGRKIADNMAWIQWIQEESLKQRQLHPEQPTFPCSECGEDTTANLGDPCPDCQMRAKYPQDASLNPEVVEEPKTPAPAGAEAPPSNVIPINRGEHRMSDVQTLTLGSGETINPETGISFANGLGDIYQEMSSRIQASIANLSAANVDQAQIAELVELLNLNEACKGKTGAMKGHFEAHRAAQEHVAASGAGTHAGYLGSR